MDVVIREFTSFTPTGYVAGIDMKTVGLVPSSADTTIDWATLDLDPSTPGVQQSVTYPGGGTISFDPSTQQLSLAQEFTQEIPTGSYTVKDSLGVTSTIGGISALLPQ